MGSSIAVFAPFAHFYQSRRNMMNNPEHQRKKEEEDEPFWADCFDCSAIPTPDCTSIGNGSEGGAFDCDCSPDCS